MNIFEIYLLRFGVGLVIYVDGTKDADMLQRWRKIF